MSLEYKFSERENLKDIQTFIVDTTQRSTKYFRVSDVPQVLQKGKNLLRITAHPTNLVDGTQIYVDVRDSNGEPIYFEIPDYLENDKSRVISIWIYNDKGIDNTPNGEATITLLGIANVDLNGNPLPPNQRGKINVKWQTTLNVDRDRNNSSEIIFNTDNVPNVVVSQSVELYENQAQTENTLTETIQTGKARYIFSGTSPIIQITDSSILNSEMINGDIILSEFTKPAVPITNIEGAQSSTFFSSSIGSILNDTTLKPLTNFTTSFDNREDLTHTYESISEANYKIQYIQSGSNVTTQNKRNFVNLEFNNIDPITGVVDKIKILAKSQGLSGDFEFLNEVQIPYSSSVDIKVPIPSKNLNDPKILKLLYLNAEGSISRTETISEPFVFDGEQVYIGGDDNLISGSIFISNTVGTGIEIGGASSGFMRSVGYRGITSASLGKAPGGFVIYSGSGNLVFGEDQLLGVGMQFVGDNDDRHLVFSTANGGILDVKTDKFFIGNLTEQYISGSDGNIEISSSIFHLDPKANGGDGSLIIGANATILSDLTVENIRTPAQIDGIASTEANASSSIKADGFARFVSASIGGWGITTSSIEGGNLIMKPEGILQTRDFASGLKGWKISSEGNGTAEFENVRIRGTLRTTTFEKESVNAVGGQLWVANSTTITGSVTDTETTMSVKNASGFSAGEILLIKKVDNTGFQTEYVLLNSASLDSDGSNEDETYGRIMVQRAYGSGTQGDFVGDLASSAQAYEDGQVIVSTGKLNTGYIKMNANPNDVNTPYMDIVERTGSGLYDVALKVRLGDLSGLANSDYVFGDSTPGFGLATDNVFLQGGIIAKTGSIGGIKMDDGKLFTGNGVYGNANTGFYVDSGSKFALGSKLLWNPSTETLTIRGSLQFADGTDVEGAVDAASNSSVARIVELSADKYVITFDADGNEAPSNQTITLTATPQNFTGDVYYEFYKDSSIQGSRSTTNTFSVDTTSEKPTATTPKSYEVRVFTGSSGGTAESTDSLTLFGLQPGSDGTPGENGTDSVQVILTNESHTLAAQSDGTVTSFNGADTDVIVFEGITNKTSDYTISTTNGTGVSTTLSTDNVAVTGMTNDSGSVTINVASGSVSIDKIMSLTKARQGQDGDKFADTSITTTINLTTLSVDDDITFTADTGLAWTAGLTAVLSNDSSNFINGTVISYNSVSGVMVLNVDTITGGGSYTAWSLNVGGVAGPQGLSGANAKNIVASVDSQVFSFLSASDNTAEPTSVIFSFNQQNLNNATIGSGDITITGADGTNITNFSLDNNDVDGNFSGIVSGSLSFSAATNAGGLGSDKAKLPVTISATKDGLTDSIKVFKVEGGTAGSDGTDAVTVFLTNEAHTFAAANNGDIVSFNGAFTDMEVFEGVTNTTSDYTITKSDGTGVTSTLSTNRVTISAMSHDSGSVDITATSGSTTLTKTMSLVKSKQGAQGLAGDDAKMLTITSDSPVFSFPSSSSSTAIDNTIELVINQQNLSATVSTSDLVIKDAGGNTLTNPTLAPSSLTNNTGLVSGSITFSGTVSGDKTKLPLEITITQDGLTDTLKIFKVEGGGDGVNGTDAINGFLSNESHTFPADSTGAIASFIGGTSTMSVFEGVTDVTTEYTYSKSDGTGVTSTLSGTDNNILTISALGHDSGSVNVTATSASVSITKTMSLTKARQGSDGSDGTAAKLLLGSLNSQVFAFDDNNDTSSDPLSIEFSFQQQNLSGSGGFLTIGSSDIVVKDVNDSTITGFGFDNNDVVNGTGIVSGSITFASSYTHGGVGGNKDKLPITITATKDGLSDSVRIFKVVGGAAGTSAVTALLTNDSHTLPVTSSIGVISYAGASTDIVVFQGTSDVTDDYTITRTSDSHITTTLSGDTVTITNSTTPFSGSVVITATSASVSISKTMSISQALQGDDGSDGAPGANAKTLSVTADSQIFTFSSASNTTVPDDNTIEFFFSQQNLSGTIGDTDIVVTDVNGNVITNNPTLSPSSLSGGSGVVSGSYVFATNLANDSGKFPCTVTVTKDGLTDSFKVFAISGGADGVSSLQYLLSNEAHIVPASSAGVVSSYSNSNTEIHVYEGTTALSYDGVGTGNGKWKVNTPTISPAGKITVGTADDQGDYLLVKNHSAMDNSTDSVTISYPIVGKTTDGTSFSFTKTQTITKSKEGIGGASASLISLTSDSQVFTFASSSVTTPDDNTIELFINQQNLSGTITASDITILDQQSNSHTVPTFAPSSLTDGTGVVSGSLVFGTNTPTNKLKFPITISVTKDGVTDSTKIFTLDGGSDGSDGTAGADAYTVFLTNESHTFPAASDGTVDSSNLAAGATDVVVFKGTTQLTNDNNSPYDANTYRASAAVSGITMGSTKTNNQRRFTPTAVTSDTGTATITITDNTTGTVFTKTYTFSKSKEGSDGAPGANNQDFSFLDAGISSVTGYLDAGLRFNSDVVGFHKEIAQGVTATLSDFTSFLDSSGNFYLGGNSGGMSGSAATSGYLAWNNTNRSLLISGSNANIEVDKFLLGSGTSQYISGSNGNVEIAGDVTFRGRPDNGDGNVVFFDDFSQYAGAGAVDGGDNPKNDGTGDAWWFAKKPEVALVTDSDCISGQALQIGNNTGDDEANIISNILIPFNESSLYEVEVRIKRTAGTSNTKAYVGINGMQSDGVTKVGYDGSDSTSGHYVTLQSHNLGTGSGTGNFQIFKGYLKGTGTDHHLHNSKTDPANARVEILNGYIRAYFLLNYNDQPGRVLVDYIKIKEFASGGTSRISGDSITTGTIKSNNLSADTGTALYLNDGIMKIGGTGAYTTEKGILLDGPNAKFAVGELGGNYMRFNHTAGKLEISTPNFEIDSGGAVQVTGAISVLDADGNAITLGDPAEAVENLFNEITNPSAGISALDGRPADFFSTYGNNVASNIKFNDFGGTIGKVLELSNPGDTTIGMSTKIIKNEASAYRITITVKGGATNYTSGTSGMYLRVYETDDASAREDGVKFITIDNHANSSSSEPGYLSSSGEATLSWTKISGSAGVGNVSNNLNGSYWPQEWITYQTNYTPSAGTEFFSMNILNWSGNGLNHAYVRDLVIKPKTNLGTQIGGRQIKTGELQSLNLSPNEGSVISLDSGSMKLGGFASPGFEVSKEGFVTATNIVEKYVNVNNANSGSYYQTVSGHTTLVLDGSLGGNVTMNLTLQVAPPYVINDILFPANAGSDDIARLELSIQDDGIQFDDGAITSGYSSFGLILQQYTLSSKSGVSFN